MKEICVSLISEKIAELCLKANYDLPGDIKNKLRLSLDEEETEVCKSALRSIIKNTDAAKKYNIPICQDKMCIRDSVIL